MSLEKEKSKKAFKHNVRTETKALEAKGKSPKQAVAIAYSEKRAAEKKKK